MSLTTSELPVLIVGAGIAGLSLARILHQKKVPFHVYDTLPEDYAQGYGISLLSWAWQPLLDVLGQDALELRRFAATDAPVGGIGEICTTCLDVYTGEPLLELGNKQGSVFRANRAALRRFLLQGIDLNKVHFQTTLKEFTTKLDHVQATFTDGSVVKGSLLVAADGVHSTVRKLLIQEVKPRHLPATVISGQVELAKPDYDSLIEPYMRHTAVSAGMGENFMFGVHKVLVTPEAASIGWTYSTPNIESGPEDEHALPEDAIKATLLPLHDKMAKPFSSLVSQKVLDNQALYHWPMRSIRMPHDSLLAALGSSKVAFIGDAAHAMPIFAGEGGNHGILDGVELGLALADGTADLKGAVRQFYGQAYARWQKGIDGSEKRLGSLHMPMHAWKAVAEKMKAADKQEK